MSLDADLAMERRVANRVVLICLCFFPAVAVINAMSLQADAERDALALNPLVPWLQEFTSVGVLLALVWLPIMLERRFPLVEGRWLRAVAALAAGSIAFSALHVAGMVALRAIIMPPLTGCECDFLDDPLREFIYEYRKDVLPYAVIIGLASLSRSIEQSRLEAMAARSEAQESGRLTLKSGGRTLFVDASSMEWARAAGNYVELRSSGRTMLPRISLGALEEQLRAAGVDVVRVHRSHLVNRAMIAEIQPSGDGDLRIRLRDGSEVRGSRRYRDRLAV